MILGRAPVSRATWMLRKTSWAFCYTKEVSIVEDTAEPRHLLGLVAPSAYGHMSGRHQLSVTLAAAHLRPAHQALKPLRASRGIPGM